jgi:hypothetical protein
MLDLIVKDNIKELNKTLTRIEKKQLPFAISLGINNTAKDVMKAEKVQTSKKLDRPTSFTQNAFKIKWSNKNNQEASVFIKPIQAKYLKYQVEGGKRTGRIGVPYKHAKLNKFGNIPGRRKGFIKNKNQFIGKIKNIDGVWERTGGKRNRGIKLMVGFEPVVSYRKRFPFYKIGKGVVNSKFKKNLNKSLEKALSTAR